MGTATKRRSRLDTEELILYGVLAVIGAIPVMMAIAQHAVFGVDATLGLLMLIAGIGGVAYLLGLARRERK